MSEDVGFRRWPISDREHAFQSSIFSKTSGGFICTEEPDRAPVRGVLNFSFESASSFK